MNVKRRRLTIEPAHWYPSIVRQCPLDQPFRTLLRADRREAVEPGTDAAYRRAVPGDTVLWCSSNGPANAAPALNSLIKPPTVRTNGATSVQMELSER
jgi:hypothetical protein